MKLIIGLGNPGKEYVKTRHNIGFSFIDTFANYKNVEITKEKFNGKYIEFLENKEKVILLKSLSYMNLSGEVIKKYIDFFKIDVEDILIISDDLDMPVGKIKLKYKGSSGGHNGIQNIIDHLHTEEFKRLKIGIDNDKNRETKDYVLSKFTKEEEKTLKELEPIILNILDDFISLDFDVVMNRYNQK